jgi:integrase
MPKLTKRLVDSEPAGDKDRFVWDDEIPGYGLKIYKKTGVKSFVYQYRSPTHGESRRFSIGKYSGALTVEQARAIAKKLAHTVYSGHDPMAEKQALRGALSVNEMLDAYVASEQFAGNAETTKATDRGRIDRHLRRLLGKAPADSVTHEQVLKAHRAIREGRTAARVKTKARGLAKVTGGPGTADQSIRLLSTCYTWAIKNKLTKTNPVAGMKFGKSGVREMILSDSSDYARLFSTLDRMENEKRIRPAAADAIRFIAFTGARRSEVTRLRREWVDLKSGLIKIPPPDHKTGRKTQRPRIIAPPAAAREIIERQPECERGYVFSPAKGEGPISLGKIWQQVREEAKLPPNLGLHGLRHSIGTHLAMSGASAVELMETLGHKQVSTTLRYIHFVEDARSKLAERAAAVAVLGLNGKKKRAAKTPA